MSRHKIYSRDRNKFQISKNTLVFLCVLLSTFSPDQQEQGARAARQKKLKVKFESNSNGHLSKSAVIKWLQHSREAVSQYYGLFPINIEDLTVTIDEEEGDSVGLGTTNAEERQAAIEIRIGEDISESRLMHDWTATHEMTHLAMPILGRADRWVAEGMATYVEPIARLQLGQVSPEEIWGDLARNAPRALRRQDKGFRGTRDLGELYWGGAIWCLLADIQIRQKTQNRFGFQDAMRGIVKSGATVFSDYSARDALKSGDEAIGASVLVPLYEQFSTGPINVDHDDLLQKLGIIRSGGTVHFDNTAPLANIRRAIEAGKEPG